MQHNNNICSAAKSGFVASFLVAAVALITIMFDNIQIEFFANADVLPWLQSSVRIISSTILRGISETVF